MQKDGPTPVPHWLDASLPRRRRILQRPKPGQSTKTVRLVGQGPRDAACLCQLGSNVERLTELALAGRTWRCLNWHSRPTRGHDVGPVLLHTILLCRFWACLSLGATLPASLAASRCISHRNYRPDRCGPARRYLVGSLDFVTKAKGGLMHHSSQPPSHRRLSFSRSPLILQH